jgi:hypothetical protein
VKDTIILQSEIFDSTSLVLKKLGITGPTLRRLVAQGVVSPPVRFGKKHFYPRKAVETEFEAKLLETRFADTL